MSTSFINTSTLEHLQQIYPGVLLLNSRQTATVLNVPFKTLSNAGSDFPIPAIKFGPRKFFRLIDIADHVDVLLGIKAPSIRMMPSPETPPVPTLPTLVPKRGRGRPRKGRAE